MSRLWILEVAVPSPLHQTFDYTFTHDTAPSPGSRVEISFGRQQLCGIINHCRPAEDSPPSQFKLKSINRLIDQTPLLSSHTLKLLQWVSHYYIHPIGETLTYGLPSALRQGIEAQRSQETFYQLKEPLDLSSLRANAKRLWQAIEILREQPNLSTARYRELGIQKSSLSSLIDKGLVISHEGDRSLNKILSENDQAKTLNSEQQAAVEAINAAHKQFTPLLIEGVTGSGKTEVYLQAIAHTLAQQQQVLLLIPEIGLSPQTISRFQRRFNCQIGLIHSGLNEQSRLDAWLDAKSGKARILIGTRSATFCDLPDLGLIIIDEEHDASFKQQDTLRYHARDCLIKRAQMLNIPIVLGSATPSLESLANAEMGRQQLLAIKHPAVVKTPAEIELIDVRHQTMEGGISNVLFEHIQDCIKQNQQTLLFINRRGFAPMIMCNDCGWMAECPHCDTRMTAHRKQHYMHCHHCDHRTSIAQHCPSCRSSSLDFIGSGTQRIEESIQSQFPNTPVIRIDRDSSSNRATLEQQLETIQSGEPCIIVGTQMLAKGHHFHNVTLVGILDADAGLFSTDFRAAERFGQLVTQVAGRAGREITGKVYIQTHLPEHTGLIKLISRGYGVYARELLRERQQAMLPPFGKMALIRADHTHPLKAMEFLRQARQILEQLKLDVQIIGPMQAPIAKRAKRYRWQLQILSQDHAKRQHCCQSFLHNLKLLQSPSGLRWSMDIDPQDHS